MPRSEAITNSADILDSRDIIARIEELESELEALEEEAEADHGNTQENSAAQGELTEWNNSEGRELKALREFASEGESCADWPHGETLIRDSYFQEYAQELADDLGAIPKDAAWPLTCIDWNQAARELKQDYTSLEFDGVTYWARS